MRLGFKQSRLFLGLIQFLSLFLTFGCAQVQLNRHPYPVHDVESVESLAEHVRPAADQLLAVLGEGDASPRARLYVLEREGTQWKRVDGPIAATIGRNGFARMGDKREGDGRTPSGVFPLEFVFGYAPEWTTKMPYRQATENDIWVDDPNSPDYNRWVRKGETSAASFEQMRLPDNRYRHGIVIGYNRAPVVKGKGSAIFIHGWQTPGQPTAGCVALDENQLVKIIDWLDPRSKPAILMGNLADLAEL